MRLAVDYHQHFHMQHECVGEGTQQWFINTETTMAASEKKSVFIQRFGYLHCCGMLSLIWLQATLHEKKKNVSKKIKINKQ